MIKQLNKSTVETVGRPVRILQFGDGNFLRAFVDWQIDIANEKGVMDAGVAVCQPIIDPERKVLGMIDLMHRQDNMYHVYLEGIENKRPKKDVRLVKSIMDSFNPYVDYAKYEAYFLSPELKITISNTTEAGIRYEEGDDLTACPPKSYPAKMTALLYKRFHDSAIESLKENPYLLCDPYYDVDFRLADGLAIELGLSMLSDDRTDAGIVYTLAFDLGNGDAIIPLDELTTAVIRLLSDEDAVFDEDRILAGILRLADKGILVREEIAGRDAVYLRDMHDAEAYLAHMLSDMSERNYEYDFDVDSLLHGLFDDSEFP